ncbi:MAG: response regulator [Bacteroidales bacterium]|nr:response regulator [Bacteroidales bacterium]
MTKSAKYLVLAGSFLILGGEILCQKILYHNANNINARFDTFVIDNGKSDPAVTSIMQDRKGFIWCGTETGLYRFDGINYYKYSYGENEYSLHGAFLQSIFEDSNGNIWVGTYGALNRIDLNSDRISYFIPDTTDIISPDNTIRLINEDRNGLLWLITDRDIFTFDSESQSFTRFGIDSLAWRSGHNPIVCEYDRFLEDKSGRIWIATDNGLYLFDKEWRRFYPGENDLCTSEKCKINCVREDKRGMIWFGTEDKGLMKITDPEKGLYEQVKLIYTDRITSNIKKIITTVTDIFTDTSDYLWITGNNALTRLNPQNGETAGYYLSDKHVTKKWENDLRINRIFGGNDGSLWFIDLYKGLMFRFVRGTEYLFLYYVPANIDFTCIQDNTGNFWIGSVANHMFRLVADSLPFMAMPINSNEWVESTRRTAITEDDQGTIWLAVTGGIYSIKESDITHGSALKKLAIPGIDVPAKCIYRDNSGNSWFGLVRGTIVKYDPDRNLFREFRLPIDDFTPAYSGVPYVFAEDKSGTIWVATRIEGIFKLPAGAKRFEKHIDYDELSGKNSEAYLEDFIVDSSDELWIATYDGLFRTDNYKTKITDYTGFDNTGRTINNNYLRISEDSNRNIWILNSQGGPYLFNRKAGTFSKVKIPELSGAMGFSDLLLDNDGRIWLTRYDRITVIDTLKKNAKDFYMPVKGFEAQSFSLKSGINLFMVGNRLMIIKRVIPLNREKPPVYITNLYVNDKEFKTLYPRTEPVTDIKKIDLRYDQNNIRIGYAALNYNRPLFNQYRYFMKGLDRDTVQAGSDMTVEYRQMPPGRYEFWVTGSNNDDIWNPAGTSFEIHIHPPWYRSTVAYILYILTLISIIAGYIRYRTYSLIKDKALLEGQIKEHTAELERKNLQLAETDRLKTDFFTGISHEIRTPLSLIIDPLEKLSGKEGLDEKTSGIIEIMQRNAQRLMQLVTQLLDISRLDAGKMKITLIEGDLIKHLRMLVYEFLSLAESRQIKYIAELPDYEFVTLFDRDKIEKVVSNLLSNAFKFTPQDGTVKCTVEILRNEEGKTKDTLKIRVSDSGSGISREHLGRIFDRFYRVEGINEYGGTGIGLTITQELIRLMHGEITVVSEKDTGSEFSVTIPLGSEHLDEDEYVIIGKEEAAPEKPVNTMRSILTKAGTELPREGKMSLLIIEDNADLRNYLQSNLSDEYNVMCSENGGTGLHTAFTMMPDLIVTDIMMPDLDGISLCDRLKNNELTSHIPVILLSAKSTLADKIKGLESGADDYIIKPFSIDELKIRISNLMSLREKLRLKYSNLGRFTARKDNIKSVDDRFMEKVIHIIEENVRDFDFSVALLHEKAGMSRMHLTRKLKILTGLTPGILIRNIRLEKSAELILHKAGNMTEIANSVGFSNPSYFTKSFRQYFGVSPKNYSKH